MLSTLFILTFLQTATAAEIKNPTVTDDPVELYNKYKDFSFPIMTKEVDDVGGLNKVLANLSVSISHTMWAGVQQLGQFNAAAVNFLFDFDALGPIRDPILDLTNEAAGTLFGIVTILGSIGIAIVMVVKFAMEQNIKRALYVFMMGILIVAAFALLKSPESSKQVMSYATDIDTAVTDGIIKANQSDDEKDKTSAGEKIAANVFKANVFVPYLVLNYGSSNIEKINKKSIKYKDKKYNRIGLLVGNADSQDDNFVSDIAKIEYDDLGNKNVSWTKAMGQGVIMIFFLCLNLVQFLIYFILFLLKQMLGFLLLFLFPLSLFVLFMAMFSSTMNPFKNLAKGYMTVVILKGFVSFFAFFFASYMIIAYHTSDKYDNVFIKILVVLLYICLPISLYVFRKFLGSLFRAMVTANGSVQGQGMGGIMRQFMQPRSNFMSGNKNRQNKRKNDPSRKQENKKPKPFQELIRMPKHAFDRANQFRANQVEKFAENRAKEQAGKERIHESEARRAHSEREQDYNKVFQDIPVGHGPNGELTAQQIQRNKKAEAIQTKHEEKRRAEKQGQRSQEHKQAANTYFNQLRQKRNENSEARRGIITPSATQPGKRGKVIKPSGTNTVLNPEQRLRNRQSVQNQAHPHLNRTSGPINGGHQVQSSLPKNRNLNGIRQGNGSTNQVVMPSIVSPMENRPSIQNGQHHYGNSMSPSPRKTNGSSHAMKRMQRGKTSTSKIMESKGRVKATKSVGKRPLGTRPRQVKNTQQIPRRRR